MENIKQQIKEKIQESDMVVIGIGELCAVRTREMEHTQPYADILQSMTQDEQSKELLWALEQTYIGKNQEDYIHFYNQIEEMVSGKNYFVITTNADDVIYQSNFRKDRIVAPCGSITKFICPDCENKEIYTLPEEILEHNKKMILDQKDMSKIKYLTCDTCKSKLIPNLYGNQKYLEEGYLDDWNLYMKWLQGSMNRKLCMLELGVGMAFPSVIRWPFEKMAFYNQKAFLYRIHDKFFQLAEGTAERAMSVPENPLSIW